MCSPLFFSLHHWLTKLESHFSNNFYIENPKKWNKKRRKSHIFQTRASKLVRTKFCRQNEMNADRKSRERKTLKVKQTERLRAGARARGGGGWMSGERANQLFVKFDQKLFVLLRAIGICAYDFVWFHEIYPESSSISQIIQLAKWFMERTVVWNFFFISQKKWQCEV